jgi:hypothetical protein
VLYLYLDFRCLNDFVFRAFSLEMRLVEKMIFQLLVKLRLKENFCSLEQKKNTLNIDRHFAENCGLKFQTPESFFFSKDEDKVITMYVFSTRSTKKCVM